MLMFILYINKYYQLKIHHLYIRYSYYISNHCLYIRMYINYFLHQYNNLNRIHIMNPSLKSIIKTYNFLNIFLIFNL